MDQSKLCKKNLLKFYFYMASTSGQSQNCGKQILCFDCSGQHRESLKYFVECVTREIPGGSRRPFVLLQICRSVLESDSAAVSDNGLG